MCPPNFGKVGMAVIAVDMTMRMTVGMMSVRGLVGNLVIGWGDVYQIWGDTYQLPSSWSATTTNMPTVLRTYMHLGIHLQLYTIQQ